MKRSTYFIGYFLLSILISVCNANFTEEDLIADVPDLGKIAGRNLSTTGDTTRPFIAFRGIPYAEPPTENRRFLPSVRRIGRLNETGDTFYAHSAGLGCIQPSALIFPPARSEDCLTINVYTPKPYKGNTSDLLPVIFYIHGGAFTTGEGNLYNGNRLMNKDIVLVSFNYRLGVLGFFSLNTEDCPGNAGMYDIVNALKWTNDYIQYFGGDPNRITIAGQSAGSVAVTHLMASPMAQGLFHGAIAASGTALATWGTTENAMIASLSIASLSNCYNPTEDGYPPDQAKLLEIAACMKNVSSTDLTISLLRYQVSERFMGRLGFEAVSPLVQSFNTSASFQKFLPEHPRHVFESGRQANVPLMIGTTRHDGSYVLGEFYNRFLKPNQLLNNTEYMRQGAVPQILKALEIPDGYGLYESIGKLYLGDSRASGNFSEMYPGFIDLFSVFFFKAPSYQTALHQAKLNNHTYWYSFDYQGSQTIWSTLFSRVDLPPFFGGITHGDDLIYLFHLTFNIMNAEEIAVINRMTSYWADFATTGNPTPTADADNTTIWSNLMTSSQARFMSIGKSSVELANYEDTWPNVGWEVLPPVQEPTTTTLSPETTPVETTPTETTPSTTTQKASANRSVSNAYTCLIILLSTNLIYYFIYNV